MKKLYVLISIVILIAVGFALALKDRQNQKTQPIPPRNDITVIE